MKQLLLRCSVLTGLLLAGASTASQAQLIDFLGPKVSVDQPASIAGSKTVTTAYGGTGGWGGPITAMQNIPVVKAYDSLACGTLLNGTGSYPALTGAFCLLYRGDCNFSTKALNAQTKGAIGVIIVNNIPGEPVGMSAGADGASVTIPVVMVSQNDGNAMNAAINAGQTVTVSTALWGFGNAHDLAFVPRSIPLPHAMAIPKSQLNAGSDPEAYNNYVGGFVANVGTNDEANVMVRAQVVFTPNAGAPATWVDDSVNIGTIAVLDSVGLGFKNQTYPMHATAAGTLDINYTTHGEHADNDNSDNHFGIQSYVTDSIFSKGRYDMTKWEPRVTLGLKFAAANTPMCWGPLYFIKNGNGQRAARVQLAISDGSDGTGSLDGHDPLLVYMFRWVDGLTNADGIIQIGDSASGGGELILDGVATKTFGTSDTTFNTFTVDVVDPSSNLPNVGLKDNSWYWIVADVSPTDYMGVDNEINYLPREIAARAQATPFAEYTTPIFAGVESDLVAGGSDATMLPFQTASQEPDSVYFPSAKGIVPNIALHLSTHGVPTSVKNVENTIADVNLFPVPAKEVLNVNVSFKQSVKKAIFHIVNTTGHTVYQESRTNISGGSVALPLNTLASGFYYLIVVTDNGSTVVKKFNIIK